MSASSTTNYSFLSPPLRPEDLGALGAYRVLSELGRGGMGFVFRAEDTRLKRAVALKVMNERIAATPYSRRRFIEEARSMAAVKHDNVATIYEVNENSGTPFMAMELLQGGTLEALTREHQQLDFRRVIHYATQMARGLAAAHAQGIIHRDIKPANIWIEADIDRVKILDFGLALAQVPVDRLAGRGTVIGTPQYLSPEQARSEPLDNRTDLYSLGVVLYEMCTGRLPFRARNVPEQLILTLIHQATPVHQVNAGMPEPLSRLISLLMEKEPRNRPRSAIELEKLLADVAQECEAKTDVAQAINKLQAQLNLVREKQPAAVPAPSLDDDLFASLPSLAVTPLLPTAKPSPLTNPALSSPSLPKVAASQMAGSGAGYRPKPAAPATRSRLPLPSYWPWIAVGAAVLVCMGLVQYVFISSTGTPHKSTVIIPDPAKSSPSPSRPADDSSQQRQPAPAPTPSTPPAPPETPEVDFYAGNNDRSAVPAASSSRNGTAQPSDEPSPAPAPLDESSMSSSEPAVEPVPEPQLVKERLVEEHVTRRSGDGRGADTSVRRGASTQEHLGDSISVQIQTRSGIDIQHSYLRFDLEGVRKKLNRADDVRLLLTVPKDGAPIGSIVRVYGVPPQYPDNWREVGPGSMNWGNSISKVGLEAVPLLAEFEVNDATESFQLSITDPRLTAFVQDTPEDFVTLILAGGSPNDKPLYFVSREGAADQSPALDFDILEADKKRGR